MKFVLIGLVASLSCYGSVLAQVNCGLGLVGGPGVMSVQCPFVPDYGSIAIATVQTQSVLPFPHAYWDGAYADAGPGAITMKQLSPNGTSSAEASLDSYFVLTITTTSGGSGFFVPCLGAYSAGTPMGIASASFAGVSVISSANSFTTTCGASPNVANAIPFTSGVSQVFEGIFAAHTTFFFNQSEAKSAFLYSFLVYDAQMNPLGIGSAQIALEMTPEPSTFLFLTGGLLAMAVLRRRFR